MMEIDIRLLRTGLGLSRADLARFLGVSEATLIRWEADVAVSRPRGLPAVMLKALNDVASNQPSQRVARLVRSSSINHMSAIRDLLAEATE